MIKIRFLLLGALLSCIGFGVFSCGVKKNLKSPDREFRRYLHLSHTRTNSNPKMDSIAESIDFNAFDMLWLGGDMAFLTSHDDKTMERTDNIYNLGSESTLWALGNHDYSDVERIEKFTKRPPYYAYYKDRITYLVLDTQENLSKIEGAQKELVLRVLDTIQSSTHLLVLHHKLIWMYDNSELQPQISSVSNARLADCDYCINPNNFNSEIYPELVKVRQKGIQVICIGGDIGFRANQFEHKTPEGIFFLASGIETGEANNKALVFEHNLTTETITWDFVNLDQL